MVAAYLIGVLRPMDWFVVKLTFLPFLTPGRANAEILLLMLNSWLLGLVSSRMSLSVRLVTAPLSIFCRFMVKRLGSLNKKCGDVF